MRLEFTSGLRKGGSKMIPEEVLDRDLLEDSTFLA